MLSDMDWQRVKSEDTPGCFIQWKGTDVCIDLYCPCGAMGHYNGGFLYAWKCPECQAVWEMGCEVRMRRAAADAECIQNPDFYKATISNP